MRKIFFLIICLFNFFIVMGTLLSPKAEYSNSEVSKPLVCQVGGDYLEYLQYDGYTIIFNDVNFNMCGEYSITYENDKTKEQIIKFIYVKDEQSLLMEKCFSEQYKIIYTSKDRLVNSVTKKLSDGSYIYSLSKETVFYSDYYDIYVRNYYNDETKFETKLFSNVKGKVVDIIEDEHEIAVLLEVAYDNDYQDLYFITLNKSGDITYQKRFEGSKIENGKKILADNNNYYIIGDTTSTDKDYSFYHSQKCGFVFVINKINKEILTHYEIINTYENNVINAVILNNKLYVITSQYNYEWLSLEYNLYIFDNLTYTLEQKKYFFTKSTETILDMKSFDNEIYISMSDYDATKDMYYSKIIKYDKNTVRKDFYEYYYPYNININLVDFNITGTDQIIVLYNLSSNRGYGYLYQITKNGEIECQIENYATDNSTYGLIDNNEFLIKDNNTIYVNDICYSIFKTPFNNTSVNYNEEIQYPQVFIDGNEKKIDNGLSKVEVDMNLFGTYPVTYYYRGINQDVVCLGNIKVLPYVNVYEGGVFDTNYQLNFNGNGILNNTIIDSDYEITKPGSYTLIVKGLNEQIKVDFTIVDATSEDIILQDNKVEVSSNVTYKDNIILATSNINNLPELSTPKVDYQIWYLLIPIFSLTLLGIVLSKKRG